MSTFLRRAAIAPQSTTPFQSFLRLPPHVRISLFRQQSRPFSLDLLVAFPHTILTDLHATGLPWAAVIPISAIVIRVFITVTMTIPSRHAMQRQIKLVPLKSAYRRAAHLQTSKMLAKKGAVETKIIQDDLKKECDEYDKALDERWLGNFRWFWRWSPLLQLPIFLSVMEAVRSMIGMQQGLLGVAQSILRESLLGTTHAADATAASSEIGSSPVGHDAVDVPTIGQVVASNLSATPSPPTTVPTVYQPEWFEPTMMTEGLPWMLDLTIADPTPFPFTMSFIVSGFMLGNILLSGPRKVPGMVISPFRRGLTRVLILFALGIGPLTLHLPAGMVYYWACSSASGLAANLLMDRMDPLKGSVKPCKRPLRIN
jgi:inner membrane protein COX18